jgi:hypothetical protein
MPIPGNRHSPSRHRPLKVFTDLRKKFLQHIQDQTTKKLHIAPWDPDLESASLIKKPKDFPDGTVKNQTKYATCFSGYPNPRRNKESKVYLKIRFVTTDPQDMPFELEAMGQELSESITEDMSIFLSKNSYACQAVKVECVGWFFGSAKSIDSKKLVPAIKEKLKIPEHVDIGVQWRTIKNETKRTYNWKSDDLPPQALHLDIDHNYAIRYTEPAARLWRKGAKTELTDCNSASYPA